MTRYAPQIDLYRVMLLQMRRSVIAGGVVINAKPVFVLTLIDVIESGLVSSNHFPYTKDLADAYQKRWIKHITNMAPTPICKPFFHLTNDQFWHIQWKEPVSFTSSSDKPNAVLMSSSSQRLTCCPSSTGVYMSFVLHTTRALT